MILWGTEEPFIFRFTLYEMPKSSSACHRLGSQSKTWRVYQFYVKINSPYIERRGREREREKDENVRENRNILWDAVLCVLTWIPTTILNSLEKKTFWARHTHTQHTHPTLCYAFLFSFPNRNPTVCLKVQVIQLNTCYGMKTGFLKKKISAEYTQITFMWLMHLFIMCWFLNPKLSFLAPSITFKRVSYTRKSI